MKLHSKLPFVGLIIAGIAFALSLLFLNPQSHAQEDAEVAKGSLMREKIAHIGNLKGAQGSELVESVSVELRKTRALLLFRLDSKDKESKLYAAYLLGVYRFEAAVPALSKNLLVEDNSGIQKREWVWGQHPVTEALIKIGKASVPAMLDILARSDNAKEREQAIIVIRYVEGSDVAPFVMSLAIKDQKDAESKERLEAALQAMNAQIAAQRKARQQ